MMNAFLFLFLCIGKTMLLLYTILESIDFLNKVQIILKLLMYFQLINTSHHFVYLLLDWVFNNATKDVAEDRKAEQNNWNNLYRTLNSLLLLITIHRFKS